MISQLRPLGISLLVHILLFVIALFLFISDKPKELPHPLKIHIALYSPAKPSHETIPRTIPHTQPISQAKQAPEVPKVSPEKTPLTKSAAPTPVAAKPAVPVPVLPSTVPSPTKPTTVVQAAPSVETPKTAPLPKIAPIAAPPQSPPPNIEKEFLNAHLGEIRALLIQNLKYPRNAQRLKMQGEVHVSFRLKSDGSVENVEVSQSSGFEILDEDAKALIKNSAPQFPKPSKSISLSVPLAYLLR